jgi:hypothetical protein
VTHGTISEGVGAQRDNAGVDAQPAPAEEMAAESTVKLGRLAWALATFAFAVAALILLTRGDYGYAEVTTAVTLAAGINLL